MRATLPFLNHQDHAFGARKKKGVVRLRQYTRLRASQILPNSNVAVPQPSAASFCNDAKLRDIWEIAKSDIHTFFPDV